VELGLLAETEPTNNASAESQPLDAFADGAPNPINTIGIKITIKKHLTSRLLKFILREYRMKINPVKFRPIKPSLKLSCMTSQLKDFSYTSLLLSNQEILSDVKPGPLLSYLYEALVEARTVKFLPPR
jgi:hypothetical protein